MSKKHILSWYKVPKTWSLLNSLGAELLSCQVAASSNCWRSMCLEIYGPLTPLHVLALQGENIRTELSDWTPVVGVCWGDLLSRARKSSGHGGKPTCLLCFIVPDCWQLTTLRLPHFKMDTVSSVSAQLWAVEILSAAEVGMGMWRGPSLLYDLTCDPDLQRPVWF